MNIPRTPSSPSLHPNSLPLFAASSRIHRRRFDSINDTIDTAHTSRTFDARRTAASSEPRRLLFCSSFSRLKRILGDSSQRPNRDFAQTGQARLPLAFLLGLSRCRWCDASLSSAHETSSANAASEVGAAGTTFNTSQHGRRVSS